MKTNSKKLALAGVLCAVAVVGSMLQFPVFGSQCAPVQHMVNVICAVFLGPGYGVAVAFLASLLRNIFGLGSLLAFPGSMCGALLCGLVCGPVLGLICGIFTPVLSSLITGMPGPAYLPLLDWVRLGKQTVMGLIRARAAAAPKK